MERRQAINNNLTAIKNKLETELSTARADLDEATKEVDLYLFIFKSFFLIFFFQLHAADERYGDSCSVEKIV